MWCPVILETSHQALLLTERTAQLAGQTPGVREVGALGITVKQELVGDIEFTLTEADLEKVDFYFLF